MNKQNNEQDDENNPLSIIQIPVRLKYYIKLVEKKKREKKDWFDLLCRPVLIDISKAQALENEEKSIMEQ